MKVLARTPSPARERPPGNRRLLAATAVAAGCLVAVGLVGTLSMRHFGRVPFSVPSWPWYHSWPFYLFWQPGLELGWAVLALPVALAAAAALVALARSARVPRRLRLAGSLVSVAALALAVAALAGGPAAWAAPLAFEGEYPGAVGQVGPIPTFIGEFPARVPTLPDFAAQHPPFATVFYLLVDRVWAGLDAAALATVTLLYLATSADAMWAPVLAGAALAADRGLRRQSWGWTLAGGVLLWLASMLTFAAALVLPFLAVRALAARAAAGWGRVLRWAAATSAVVVGLAGLTWAATGYDVVAAVAAVDGFWSHAPGTQ